MPPDEEGRQAHLAGHMAIASMTRASSLFAQDPGIEYVDILATKLPNE